jgi:hypothetical protein
MRRLAFVIVAAICTLTSSAVLVAQSAPPLIPFRGLTDHVTTTMWGQVPGGSSESNVHSISGFVLGQATLSQTGKTTAAVSVAASSLPHGTHKVEAVYLGDATFRAGRTSISLVVQ